jgi:hypothetical protein
MVCLFDTFQQLGKKMANNMVFLEIPSKDIFDFQDDFKEACPSAVLIQANPFPMLTTNTSSPVWYQVPASFLEKKPAYKPYGYKLVKLA